MKKVLFVNPRRETCDVNMPHMGLGILSSIVGKKGNGVLVVDYQLTHNAPSIGSFIRNFKPDVIGISILTANVNEAKKLIGEIRKISEEIPILVGGPHATLYPDDLEKDKRIDYVVQGEAEPLIEKLIRTAKRQKKPKRIRSDKIVDPDNVPWPDFKSFHGWETIKSYPIMTSRGCPFHCSFCPVAYVGQKKWRPRKPEECIRELEFAKKAFGSGLYVLIQDDNPLVIPERFYKFLEIYAEKIKMRLAITNVRADDVTERLIHLLKKAGCESLGIAVESGNKEVFSLINKGETLEDIERAARLLVKNKMLGSFSFVIGLPGDNLSRIKDSINFVNKFKPDSVYWNMAMPYRNTAFRIWFEKNGKVYNEIGKTSLADGDFRCDEPSVETPEFSRWQRKKAHYMALFRTVDDRLKIGRISGIFQEARRYHELNDFFYWLPRGLVKSGKRKIELIGKFISYTRREGLIEALKRSLFLMKE